MRVSAQVKLEEPWDRWDTASRRAITVAHGKAREDRTEGDMEATIAFPESPHGPLIMVVMNWAEFTAFTVDCVARLAEIVNRSRGQYNQTRVTEDVAAMTGESLYGVLESARAHQEHHASNHYYKMVLARLRGEVKEPAPRIAVQPPAATAEVPAHDQVAADNAADYGALVRAFGDAVITDGTVAEVLLDMRLRLAEYRKRTPLGAPFEIHGFAIESVLEALQLLELRTRPDEFIRKIERALAMQSDGPEDVAGQPKPTSRPN